MDSSDESGLDLADELDRPLGPEYISFKTGHAYIEGHKVIGLANELFGHGGWSSEVKSMTIDFADVINNRYNIGVSCVLRVTIKAGAYREDVGFGSSSNMPNRTQAYDKARKEATTDALKRAMRLFGDSLGNCLHNKEYVELVRRIKPEKYALDVEDLRRPRKKQKREPSKHRTNHASSSENSPQRVRHIPPDFIFDDEDENDFDGLPDPPITNKDQQSETNAPMPLPSNEDAVFVTADHANLIQSPNNQSTPLPADALFDASRGSVKNSSVPQDRSMKIPKRPKT